MKKTTFLVLAVVLLRFSLGAPKVSAKDLSLSEILEIKTKIASLKALTPRESPGIVTVVTQEEIEKSGARDLMDVLRTVPGFYFGSDTLGSVGLISRGLWTFEGKVLLTIDGVEFNDLSYGVISLGNRFPVDHIKAVEIIRGPGSAIYGGFAGLNVINIVTKKGADLQGADIKLTSGKMVDDYGHNNLSMMYGIEKEGLSGSVGGLIGRSKFSDREFTDYQGDTVDMSNASRRNPHFLNAGFEYEGFEFRVIHERYKWTEQTNWGDVPSLMENEIQHVQQVVDVKKTFKIGSMLKLTPEFRFNDQTSFFNEDPGTDATDQNSYRARISRQAGKMVAEVDFSEQLHYILGFESYFEETQDYNYWGFSDPPGIFPLGTPPDTNYTSKNLGYFTQLMYMSDYGNVTAGVRIDKPNRFESTTVPRFAYTKVFGDFNVKLLLAKSFRAPGAELLRINPDIKAETITTTEVEFGYVIDESQFISMNIFNSMVKDPLAYDYLEEEYTDGYFNYDKVSSQGLELEYKFIKDWGNVSFNYAMYSAKDNKAPPLKPEQDGKDKVLFGAPKHLAHLRFAYKPMDNLFITPTIHYIGENHTMRYDENKFNEALENNFNETTDEAKTLIDLYIYSRDLLFEGFEMGIGAANLTDEEEDFTQPYLKEGFMAPLPGPSREVYAKVGYTGKF